MLIDSFGDLSGIIDTAGGFAGGQGGDVGFASPGIWDTIKSGLSGFGDFAKAALPWANIGLGGLSAAQGIMGGQQLAKQTGIAEKAATQQGQIATAAQGAAAPVTAFSADQLSKAQAGQIPAPMQAQIDLWKQAAKQQAHDYLARAGQSDSSTMATWDAWIDQQAVAMAEQALQQESAQGIAAGGTAGGILGAASGAAGGAGNIATGQQNSIENLIASANATLAKLTAGAS